MEAAIRKVQHVVIAGIQDGTCDRESRSPAGHMADPIDAAQRRHAGQKFKAGVRDRKIDRGFSSGGACAAHIACKSAASKSICMVPFSSFPRGRGKQIGLDRWREERWPQAHGGTHRRRRDRGAKPYVGSIDPIDRSGHGETALRTAERKPVDKEFFFR